MVTVQGCLSWERVVLLLPKLLAGERHRVGWTSLGLTVERSTQTRGSSYQDTSATGFLITAMLWLQDPGTLIGVVIVQPGPFLALLSKLPMYLNGLPSVQGTALGRVL